jgi:hypothetical protein
MGLSSPGRRPSELDALMIGIPHPSLTDLMHEEDTHAESVCKRGGGRLTGSDFSHAAPVQLARSSASHVLSPGDGLQMTRTYTHGLKTQMVNLESVGNRSDLLLVHRAMGVFLPSEDASKGVSAVRLLAGGNPARSAMPTIFNRVVVFGQFDTAEVGVTQGENGWFATATSAKRCVGQGVASLIEVARRAVRNIHPLAPFYLGTVRRKGGLLSWQ